MIYAICGLVLVGCALVGKFIASRFIKRARFYDELLAFLLVLKNDINFLQSRLESVFKEYKSKVFSEEFEALKDVCINKKPLLAAGKFGFLAKEELEWLEMFFSSLGQGDSLVELNKIEAMIKQTEDKKSKAEIAKNKNAGLIYKLSIAIGITICIIIV